MTSLAPVELLGVQKPRILHAPPGVSSAGEEAADLAAHAGLLLDPWQRFALDVMLAEHLDGRWVCRECGLVVPRQNGKGAVLEARMLAGLFLFDDPLIVYTAHEFKTARQHFERLVALIKGTPSLDRRVDRISRSHGDEGITLHSGQQLLFLARTGGSGRGFSGQVVILDEAHKLPRVAIGALGPVMSTFPNPQLIYAGSAVDQTIHPEGAVFARLRERGIAGDDPELCFIEHSADEDAYLADPDAAAVDPDVWAQANPGLGRIAPEFVAWEQRSYDAETFAVERLGIGDWPSTSDEGDEVIARDTWFGLEVEGSTISGRPAFALDVNPEREYTAIAVAGRSSIDRRRHVEIVEHGRGTRWVTEEIVRLIEAYDPVVVMIDARGPSASLIPELTAAGVELREGSDDSGLIYKAGLQDMAAACGGFYDAATADPPELLHIGQPILDRSLRSARQRHRGDSGAWTWSRQAGSDISPLVAVTLAAYGHALFGKSRKPAAASAAPAQAQAPAATVGVYGDDGRLDL